VKVSEAEPGRREGEKGGGKKEGEVEEEEQGFKLAPSEYLNTIRQVDKDFRGNASDLIVTRLPSLMFSKIIIIITLVIN
jgi:hypothetical protein